MQEVHIILEVTCDNMLKGRCVAPFARDTEVIQEATLSECRQRLRELTWKLGHRQPDGTRTPDLCPWCSERSKAVGKIRRALTGNS